MFDVGNRAYGIQGSVGVMLFLSILGIILHLAMANYVYAINPGKYGIKKSPFSFIKVCFHSIIIVEGTSNRWINMKFYYSSSKI